MKQQRKKVDYSKGKIYQIICNLTGEVYIGSCANTLELRLRGHKNSKSCTSRKIIDRGNYKIELIEDYPCQTDEQLRIRERFHYDRIENINKNRPYITRQEMRLFNYERVRAYNNSHKEQHKAYYQANKEQRKAYLQAKKLAILQNVVDEVAKLD